MPKQFKTNEFQNGVFLKPSSYYERQFPAMNILILLFLLF